MTSKLPEGVPVLMYKRTQDEIIVIQHNTEPNGTAMTYADRLERDKAIARAAFLEARKEVLTEDGIYVHTVDIDEYLQSERFKELTK